MRGVVVADTGPLIGMARADCLSLLQQLYKSIIIPPAVLEELRISSDRPGARAVAAAIRAGWIETVNLQKPVDFPAFPSLVDAGEAESIQLALEKKADLLIIDDKKGRKVAERKGIRIMGTGGILISAKRAGFLDAVSPILDKLAVEGYRMSPNLWRRIMVLAGED